MNATERQSQTEFCKRIEARIDPEIVRLYHDVMEEPVEEAAYDIAASFVSLQIAHNRSLDRAWIGNLLYMAGKKKAEQEARNRKEV